MLYQFVFQLLVHAGPVPAVAASNNPTFSSCFDGSISVDGDSDGSTSIDSDDDDDDLEAPARSVCGSVAVAGCLAAAAGPAVVGVDIRAGALKTPLLALDGSASAASPICIV